MLVVSDTSSVSALLKVGHIGILRDLFGDVVIPSAVLAELLVCHPDLPNWIRTLEVKDRTLVAALLRVLDRGESEAIVLASEIHADFLLMDEKAGRTIARARGLKVIGVLGAGLSAHRKGILGCSMRTFIQELKVKAGFRISDGLVSEVLIAAGEL